MDETKATYTPVLDLEKAGRKQKYDIGVHNANYDKIDNSTGKLKKDIDDKLSKSAGGVVVGNTEFKEAVKALHFETGEVLPKGIRQEVNITRRWLETYHAPTKENVGVAKALDDELLVEVYNNVYKKTDLTGNIAYNGWTKLQNGLILQWGTDKAYKTWTTKKYPIAFKNRVLTIQVTNINASEYLDNYITPCKWDALELDKFYVVGQAENDTFTWFAIGY